MMDDSALPEDNSFINQLTSSLVERKFINVLSDLKEEANQQKIYDDGLNIVSTICTFLKGNEELLKDQTNFDLCSEIFAVIVEKGNPKELLIGFLEAADCFKDEEFFKLLLLPIQGLLMKAPGKRGKSLEWVLSMLDAHIATLPPPENRNFEGEELLLLDLDPNVQKTQDSLSNYLKFLEPFIEEVSFESEGGNNAYSDRITSQREILVKYLLVILNQPLVFHDLHIESGREKSGIQSCCLKLLKYLSQITRNFLKLLSPAPHQICSSKSGAGDSVGKVETDEEDITNLARANLAYLLFAEHLYPDFVPTVYSYAFLFEKYLSLIVSLLEQEEYLVIHKGLLLCKAMLDCIPEFSLPGYHLNGDEYVKFFNTVLRIAIYCPVKGHRSVAAALFKTLILKFTWQTRYTLLMSIATSNAHSGVQGFVIDLYKDFLHLSLSDSGIKYFCGRNLHCFIRTALKLKEGPETDILGNYDRIISGLNFIRFVVLRDSKEENITGIWDVIDTLARTYMEPLHKGIELTRAHYQLEGKNLSESKKNKSINSTVTVNGAVLPNIPPQYKTDVIEKALLSLDLIESLLSRIKELLDK